MPKTPAALARAVALTYSTLALRLHRLYRTGGYDLGIFTQYAKAFSHGRAPTSPLMAKGAALSQNGPNLFGDHFSPVLAVLGPFYRLWPHAELLLLIQAGLTAVSVFVVADSAIRKLGQRPGMYVGTAYALSWGIQQMIGFDFHEVAFELPLIAAALSAYLDERWRASAAWSLPLLLVKEDMGPTVFVLGLLLARRDRRVGVAVCVIATAVTALAMFVVIPHFATLGGLGRLGSGADAGGGYGAAVTQPWLIPIRLVWPPAKLLTVFMMLAVTGFTAAISPLALVAIPTLLQNLAIPGFWHTPRHVAAANVALRTVPSGVRVAATDNLAPHLVDRTTVYPLVTIEIIDDLPQRIDWIAADTTLPDLRSPAGKTLLRQLESDGFRTVGADDGIVILTRP